MHPNLSSHAPAARNLGVRVPELSLGDLVMWTGEQTKFSSMRNRVIYEVVEKTLMKDSIGFNYAFKIAFDIENPMFSSTRTISGSLYDLRKISLLDLGVTRMYFDEFIKNWALRQGTEVMHLPEASDVVGPDEQS